MISAVNRKFLNIFERKGQKVKLGTLLDQTVNCVSATYDFGVSGGAVSTIVLATLGVPANAVVTQIVIDALTTVTSGGSATIQLKAGSTALTDAVGKASFTGQATLALASSATAIKVSAASDLQITIATAALTAGKVRFIVKYYLSQDNK